MVTQLVGVGGAVQWFSGSGECSNSSNFREKVTVHLLLQCSCEVSCCGLSSLRTLTSVGLATTIHPFNDDILHALL